MATSYNGWPASKDRAAINVGDFHYRSKPFPAGVKRGDVATVMQYLVNALATRVEPFDDGYGCWGYNYRANINNPSSLSCHASGTAIDWRAPSHPNGSSGTFTQKQYDEITKILIELESVVRHLRGYDEMHFEIRGSAADVARVAAKIRNGTIGHYSPEDNNMAMTQADKDWLVQKMNEDRSQIMGAVRAELAELRQTVTGGTRVRDAAGNVIDPDPKNVSIADAFTKIELAQQAILAKLEAQH